MMTAGNDLMKMIWAAAHVKLFWQDANWIYIIISFTCKTDLKGQFTQIKTTFSHLLHVVFVPALNLDMLCVHLGLFCNACQPSVLIQEVLCPLYIKAICKHVARLSLMQGTTSAEFTYCCRPILSLRNDIYILLFRSSRRIMEETLCCPKYAFINVMKKRL